MAVTHQPTLRKPAQGRTVAVVGDVYRFLATGEDTNGKYALWEAIVPPGGGPPTAGRRKGSTSSKARSRSPSAASGSWQKAGTFANMPVGTLHSFKNESGQPAKMLLSVAPAGLEMIFFECGVPLAEGATTAMPTTKEEIDKLLAIAPKYGIEIKLPGH